MILHFNKEALAILDATEEDLSTVAAAIGVALLHPPKDSVKILHASIKTDGAARIALSLLLYLLTLTQEAAEYATDSRVDGEDFEGGKLH